MAAIVKPVSGSGCCDCADVVDPCSCADGCLLQCRTKAGIAELCGYEAFTDPETPPKKYRRKTLTGQINIQEWPNSADCPEATFVNKSGEDNALPSPRLSSMKFTWRYKWVPNSPGSALGTLTLFIRRDGGADADWPGENTWVWALHWTLRAGTSPDGPFGSFLSGELTYGSPTSLDTVEVENFSGYVELDYIAVHAGLGTQVAFQNSNFVWAAGEGSEISDTWDITRQYDPTTCETSTIDESERTNEGDTEEWSGFGFLPSDVNAYGPSRLNVTVEETQRTYTGVDVCTESAPYRKYFGEVVEALEDEDTEQDAYDRSTPTVSEWSTPTSCAAATTFRTVRTTGFSFAWQIAQVRAAVPSPEPNAIYNITIYTSSRPVGVGGPFLEDGPYVVLQVQADSDPESVDWTDWIDLPNEEGTEIRASRCTIERIA